MNDLIHAYLDDTVSKEERLKLASWIKERPENAQQFAKSVMLHDRLQHELKYGDSFSDQESEYTDASPVPLDRVRSLQHQNWHYQLAALVALTLSIIYWLAPPNSQENRSAAIPSTYATLAHLNNAEFTSTESPQRGQRLGSEGISLRTGLVRLQFDTGVEVTLQGPARYEILSAETTRLSEGQLTASVPPGAEGFTVETPTAEITDLGTAFGLELDPSGASEVSVFSGEVTVAKRGSDIVQSIGEGQAVRIGSNQNPTPMTFDPSPFEKHWPISSGIDHSSGAFRLIPPWRRLRFARSDRHIFVRQEGYIGTLNKPLAVNISQPGEYTQEAQLTPTELPTEQVVRSLILHYQPREPRIRNDVQRLIGEITFASPILGIITQHEELKASARRFSRMPAGEEHPRRELNLNGRPVGDRIELSQDRKTLRLDLASPRFSSDLIRVILDARGPSLELAIASRPHEG